MKMEIMQQNEEIWDLFTRKEEYNPPLLDKHGRFPFFLSKNREVLKPTVSQFLMNNGQVIEYPDKKKFAVCLTHDIDRVFQHFRERLISSGKSLSRFHLKSALEQFFTLDPFRNFQEIINLEEKYNAKSTFFFITANEGNSYEPIYKINDLKNDLKSILEQGWGIGLHGGYYTYNDVERMILEKKCLERVVDKKIIGYRNHYLRFKTPETWEKLSEAGFKYDTTFGFPGMVGFRNGMCHPFKPYNIDKKSEINIFEIPLVIMDVTLNTYMHLDLVDRWRICKQLIDKTKESQGVITILWHNTRFNEPLDRTWKKLYEKILRYCNEKDAWITSAENITKWFEKNGWWNRV